MMPETPATATRSIEVRNHYLHLPVRTGAPVRKLAVTVGGVRHAFDIELAEGSDDADWWAFFDLSSFAGSTLSVDLEGDPSPALQALYQSDEIVGAETLYREARRPQLRFSSRRGWLNDPNGLVFFDGEYHLFYQHNPYGVAWGNMHWGHAVSPDLVHWTELPIALYPDELGPMFSGSAFVDWNNSGGLQTGEKPALVTAFTGAKEPFTQGLALSNDRGRTWEKYAGNPVLPGEGVSSRDPKVIWHAPTNRWVMALYIDRFVQDEHTDAPFEEQLTVMHEVNSYGIYTSTDLKSWELASEYLIPGDAECPELFELPIEGRAGESRWITFGAMGFYLIGSFDGTTFTPESGPHVLSEGDCFYASQTYTDIPASDGRRILVPWGRNWVDPTASSAGPLFAGMPFSQSMGIPVELTLHDTPEGLRMLTNPIRELASLRHSTTSICGEPLTPGQNPLAGLTGELWEIDAEIAVGDATTIVLEVRGVPITYDVASRELSCGEKSATLDPVDGAVRLHVLVDRTAIDIFGNDGRLYMPMGVDLSSGDPSLSLRSEGGDARITTLEIHQLASAWA